MAERHRRVLVVDDNLDLAENLQEILETEGFEAVACPSGEEALRALEGRAFGLVLTDMRMPGLSGLQVLHRVRASFPAVPVVVMTAYSDQTVLDAARADGALAVVHKPVGTEHLITIVHAAITPRSRLLLVEDETSLRIDLSEILQGEGALPYGCGTLEQARHLLETVPIDAAIVDLGLPDGDGVELLHELRGDDSAGKLPVLIITGQEDRLSAPEGLVGSGPVLVLAKPFSPTSLLERLRAVETSSAERISRTRADS